MHGLPSTETAHQVTTLCIASPPLSGSDIKYLDKNAFCLFFVICIISLSGCQYCMLVLAKHRNYSEYSTLAMLVLK